MSVPESQLGSIVSVLIAHYQGAREDIREKLAKRDQYIILWATGTAIIFGNYHLDKARPIC